MTTLREYINLIESYTNILPAKFYHGSMELHAKPSRRKWSGDERKSSLGISSQADSRTQLTTVPVRTY